MQVRIVERPELVLAGQSARLPLTEERTNPHMAEFVASVPGEQRQRLADRPGGGGSVGGGDEPGPAPAGAPGGLGRGRDGMAAVPDLGLVLL